MAKRFILDRKEDETGTSGIGVVAEGVMFENGKAALCWLTERSSVAIYDTMADLIEIHGHGGKTVARWID